MKVFRSLQEIPSDFGPTVASMGNFDGVHLGHQDVLHAIKAEASALNCRSIAITFDPHPEKFLRPSQAPKLIAPMPARLNLLAATGIDATLILPFDNSLACLSARACVEEILVRRLQVRSMHEGENFRFGHRAEAGVTELANFGRQFAEESGQGFTLTIHPPVETHGLTVSSTAIRDAIAAGDLRRARWMLGRPFAIHSTQARGRGIGTRLLVPTINLAPYQELLPANGVYITRLTIGENGPCFNSVTNAGNRPTFGELSFAIESHLLNFDAANPPELTEETPLTLEFLHYLRPEKTFPSPEALKVQIMQDVRRSQRYFRHLARQA